MSVFLPNLILKDVTCIDTELLNKNGIKGLILDVDNTLTTHGSQEVEENILTWLAFMKKQNIGLVIVSNNTFDRISPFAQKIGLEFVAMGLKPLTSGLSKAQARLNLKKNEIAIVGDQIYTDIVGGNLKGFFTILVTPFKVEGKLFFKIKRKLESMHIKKYHRKLGKNLQNK